MTFILRRLITLIRPLALAGCFGGGMSDGMQLTAEEAAASPPPEDGPIKSAPTTSTTSSPTETFIARQKIAEHRRKLTHAHRLLPSINPATEGNTPPQSGDQAGAAGCRSGIHKRAAAAGDVTTLGVTQE